ncbi:MAG: hypothetical protein ACRCSI_11490, partial [Eubacterium aggregans]
MVYQACDGLFYNPICIYCREKLIDPNYRVMFAMLNEILSDLASLSISLQKANLNPLEALHYARSMVSKLS